MSDAEIIRRLIRDVEGLKAEQKRLSSLVRLFEVWNTNEPAQITASQNAYDVGDYGFLSLTASPAINMNGMVGGVEGRLLLIRVAGGSSNITMVHQSGSAAAADRISTYTGANIALTARQAALFLYATVGGVSSWLMLMSS